MVQPRPHYHAKDASKQCQQQHWCRLLGRADPARKKAKYAQSEIFQGQEKVITGVDAAWFQVKGLADTVLIVSVALPGVTVVVGDANTWKVPAADVVYVTVLVDDLLYVEDAQVAPIVTEVPVMGVPFSSLAIRMALTP